ncbi:cytochrome P450, putative [Perkinsus marinus ATCC 50983]|uniref:Cytochrome P450, putative n=1 Tax=Perkinsus marinus (strain ATCC 50983 / TXsc) TaxID=423536 RepID=C5M1A0_PERM5|nr:cytochrome P450, putative [Perkinsus marinus ATCC 50983]EEQ97222.1 cytochrome P450, putative [Perkinsus marinus ATCC 50983]|eukprot:XP_002764505.1 cytochrome P450, putative [Perkinsus marinus ATCC 50983]
MKRRPRQFSAPDFEKILDAANMATTEGDEWKKHRRVSSRPLTESNLNKLMPMMVAVGEDLVTKIKGSADKQGTVIWRPVEAFQLCTSRVASAVFMGEDDLLHSQDPLFSDEVQDEFLKFMRDVLEITMKPTCIFYYDRLLYRMMFPGVRKLVQRWDRLRSKILDSTHVSVVNRLERPGPCKSLPTCAGDLYSETEIAHAFAMYIGGGSETTASAVAWLLNNFCVYPEVQQKAREEADSIGDISADSICNMPYIEACALESLRLNPSVPVSINRALVDCEVAGLPVKAGTQLIFLISRIMRENYEEGDKFMQDSMLRPERWLTQSGGAIDEKMRSEFFAFGFGPRKCPGRSLALREIISNAVLLLRNFDDFRLTEDWSTSPKFSSTLTTCPQNLVVKMRCRHAA